ncbi:MAG: hypothetical protein HYT89_01130 [Candidatus Omnitrophica bacterium]|nr:hypothetical protein [Candidatus Omnitrophota bacterium]
MVPQKPKSIHQLEERMEGLEPGSFRYKALDAARGFKSSWIELGQCLFSVYRDKSYREWGYLTFEAYCAKEIGIRQPTAVKLLKSYAFLEREEPAFLKREALEERQPSRIPGYESVNALRLAKDNKDLSPTDYEAIREEVLDHAKEDGEVKKKIRYILKGGAKKSPGSDQEERALAIKGLRDGLERLKRRMAELGLPEKAVRKMEEILEIIR